MKKNSFKFNKKDSESIEKIDTKKCLTCGEKFIPDKESVVFGTKKWDKHTFKQSCKCLPNGVRFIIG